MKHVDDLLTVLDKLLCPQSGCPWDKEQTLLSMRRSVLEETCELIEAIDLNDGKHIEEELGDLFFNVLFLGRLAEKEEKCTLESALRNVTQKLIHRHPHIFGNTEITSSEQVLEQWDKIKSEDKDKNDHESALDGIPKGLPSLARAKKMIKKMRKSGFMLDKCVSDINEGDDELKLGLKFFNLVEENSSKQKSIDVEQALKRVLAILEEAFRKFEKARN